MTVYKFHFIYKTTCILNEKFYIGMHSTSNLDDGYIGSGKRLRYSINKHGKENHKCEILEYLPDRNSLKEREKTIINEELILNENCLNLQPGGSGGFCSFEHNKKCSTAGGKAIKEKIQNDEELKARYKILGKSLKGKQYHGNVQQIGNCWITNIETGSNKFIKPDKISEFINDGWRKGKTVKKYSKNKKL